METKTRNQIFFFQVGQVERILDRRIDLRGRGYRDQVLHIVQLAFDSQLNIVAKDPAVSLAELVILETCHLTMTTNKPQRNPEAERGIGHGKDENRLQDLIRPKCLREPFDTYAGE